MRRARRFFKNSDKGRAVLERAVLQTAEDARIQGCPTRKKIIKKKAYAIAAARRCTLQFGVPHRHYRCRHCRHFHTTTKGAGINPETGKREDPAKILKAAPARSLAGSTVKLMRKRNEDGS